MAKENYDCEVVAFVADVGQGEEEQRTKKKRKHLALLSATSLT